MPGRKEKALSDQGLLLFALFGKARLLAKLPIQILDGIHDHVGAHGDEQDVLGHTHKALPCRRFSQLDADGVGQIEDDHIPGQRLADGPFLGLARGRQPFLFLASPGGQPPLLNSPAK